MQTELKKTDLAEQTPNDENAVPIETSRTIHRVLQSFGNADAGALHILHQDLFDSRPAVVLSVLSALREIKNEKSLMYISRLLNHSKFEVQQAAVKAIGEAGYTDSYKVLLDLFKTSQNEHLRLAILKALSILAPKEHEVLALVRAFAGSQGVQPETRGCATSILFDLDDQLDIEWVIKEASSDPAAFDAILRRAKDDPDLAKALIDQGAGGFYRLSAENRKLLISIASPFSIPGTSEIIFESLRDPNPAIRKEAYRVIGKDAKQCIIFDRIVDFLSERVEPSIQIEEEVRAAIIRMEECLKESGTRLVSRLQEKIVTQVEALLEQLKKSGNRGMSDSHEIGWYIIRSKEYLEYYGDEDLKHAIVQYLKGSENYTMEELIQFVKNSAVKVEVRHFEGYNALLDIVKKPKMKGSALITRELSLAKLGKREIMYKLMRNLRLSRLVGVYGKEHLFHSIFSWAKDARLFRLAESALYALAKANIKMTTTACLECMNPPVESKILAIASMHLLKDLNWEAMEMAVTKLMERSREPYVLLNLTDALLNLPVSISGDLIEVMLKRLSSEYDQEILSRIARLLGEKADFYVSDELTRIFQLQNDEKKATILSIFEQLFINNRISSDVGLSEFLYKVLREESVKNKIRAGALLYRLGDDYALEVLKDLLGNAELEDKVDVVRSLKGTLKPDILPVLSSLLFNDNSILQESLCETFLSAADQDTKSKLVELIIACRESDFFDEADAPDQGVGQTHMSFAQEKRAYKFEKEHIVKCVVFFTDIQGYTQKSQELTSMELSLLIQEYEGILIPIVQTHEGELIKRMGDGHLFIFDKPLNGVLAGIRLQKAIKRFNSFREEKLRITIRVGIHWGDVVKKDGDVLGNTVNIASRLESSAAGGSVYISHELNEAVKKYFLSKEIGSVRVKGIDRPLDVFEPYELAIGLSAKLDPVKRKHTPGTRQQEELPDAEKEIEPKRSEVLEAAKKMNSSERMDRWVRNTFILLHNLCLKVEKGEAGVGELRKELVKRYNVMKNGFKLRAVEK